MEALFVKADNDEELNTSYYRVVFPAHYLNEAGHTVHMVTQPPASTRDYLPVIDNEIDYINMPDTVLWERTITRERVAKLRANGVKRIVVTFDDNYSMLPQYDVSYRYWHTTKIYTDWLTALGEVDAVIVPSKLLADDYSKYGKTVVVPNYHDPRLWAFEKPKDDRIVIGWGGSMGHDRSWIKTNVAAGLRKFQDKHSNSVFKLYGCHEARDTLKQLGVQFEYSEWVEFTVWPQEILKFNLGVAPLFGDYDRRRSNLKAVEYGLGGVPWVGTALEPYTDHEGEHGGLLVRNGASAETWCEALEQALKMSKLLTKRGKAYGELYQMPKHTSQYEEILWG